MKHLRIPKHRVEQVVNALYERWSETYVTPSGRCRERFNRYCEQVDGMYGCYTKFVVNGVVYIDHEDYGQFSSLSNFELTETVLELHEKFGYNNILIEMINTYA